MQDKIKHIIDDGRITEESVKKAWDVSQQAIVMNPIHEDSCFKIAGNISAVFGPEFLPSSREKNPF